MRKHWKQWGTRGPQMGTVQCWPKGWDKDERIAALKLGALFGAMIGLMVWGMIV